jgi:hypothetical protein
MTPVLGDLDAVAPDLNRFVLQLGPFAQAADPAVQRLGDATDVGRDALVRSRPIVQDLGRFASAARPLSANLKSLTVSLRDTGGIERAMDYLFYQVAAINGFDSVGHYLRAGLIVNTCSQYTVSSSPDCTANFQDTGADADAAAASAATSTATPGYADTRRSPGLRRLDAYLRGLDPDKAVPGTTAATEPGDATTPAAPTPAAPASATAQPVSAPADTTTGPLLDYLMGG